MSIQCDCPFCPLTERNVNICDVVISFPTETTVMHKNIPDNYQDLKAHFITLALYFKNNKKVNKKGKTMSINNEEMTCIAECIKKNHMKLCFHTLKK
jgi:hypothetical protein